MPRHRYSARGYRGHAAKSDANQKELVAALEQLPGVTVVVIGKPVDLLVGYRGINHLWEVKNPDGKNRVEPDQQSFFENWTGRTPAVVRSLEDCLRELGLS